MSGRRVNDNELLVLDHSTMSGRRANDNELLPLVGPQYDVWS